MNQTGWNPLISQFIREKIPFLKTVARWNPCFLSIGFTSSTFPIQPEFSQNQPAAITLNTGSPQTLMCVGQDIRTPGVLFFCSRVSEACASPFLSICCILAEVRSDSCAVSSSSSCCVGSQHGWSWRRRTRRSMMRLSDGQLPRLAPHRPYPAELLHLLSSANTIARSSYLSTNGLVSTSDHHREPYYHFAASEWHSWYYICWLRPLSGTGKSRLRCLGYIVCT